MFSVKLQTPALFLLMALLAISCARNPVTGKRQLSFMSTKQEKSMGAEYDPQILQMYGEYKDAELNNYLSSKGQAMAKLSHRPNLGYTFRLLDSPIINAFAVPGGYIYFTRGIMAHFNNEAEMAGVLGHEIGHITARHSNEQMTRQTLAQIAMIGGLILQPEFAQYADAASQGLGLMFLRFSRDNERESDKLGVQYSTRLLYDSRNMAEFFKTLKRKSGDAEGALPSFLSTHPDPGERYENVNLYTQQMIEKYDVKQSALVTKRNEYLKKIDGLLYGQDPKQGFVENNVFYHPELKFQYVVPSNWRLNNTPSQVQMSEPNGKAVILFDLEQGNNLSTVANNVIQRNNIQVIEQANVTVNGMPAIAISGETTSQGQNGQQSTLRIMTYIIQYNNLLYKFVGLSSKQDFNSFFRVFQSTMQSFNKLTDPDKLNRLPERIKIVTSNSNRTLKQYLTEYGIPSSRHEEFAILNGMQQNDIVTSGMMFKVVEKRAQK